MTNKVAIIGGGVIGGGWAARFLLNGWDVRLFDPDPESTRKIGEVLANARASLPRLYDAPLPPEGSLTHTAHIAEAVAGVAWVQESVPERLEVKHKVFAEIQETLDPEAVIGSSTSGFKPSELQEGAKDPGQILVTHPFNPVYLLPLVEVVGGERADPRALNWAEEVMRRIGMYPLRVRKEIDAHIADRFLEAVWREALWLIRDGIATTEEIDEAIRMGFGLRWAQMGLFETYRVAGGEAGMRHFMAQFGPALKWPWTKLMDVPELTDELIDSIAAQSDAQSGMHSIRELERIRDDNLVGFLRVLKARDWGAGTVLREQEQRLAPGMTGFHLAPAPEPYITLMRQVLPGWIDYNGHMTEFRYGQQFADASDSLMLAIGVDGQSAAHGSAYYTAESHVRYKAEMKSGERFYVTTQIVNHDEKRLLLWHELYSEEDARLCATGAQMLLHVGRDGVCPAPEAVMSLLAPLAKAHSGLPRPAALGHHIGQQK